MCEKNDKQLQEKLQQFKSWIMCDARKCLATEANVASVLVILSGIEAYGKILLFPYQKKNPKFDNVPSKKAFLKFIIKYFPKQKYSRNKAEKIYKHFRCGLFHSHILGYKSKEGYFITKDGCEGKELFFSNEHLWFANNNDKKIYLKEYKPKSKYSKNYTRLIINANTFINDFDVAISAFEDDALYKNGVIYKRTKLAFNL